MPLIYNVHAPTEQKITRNPRPVQRNTIKAAPCSSAFGRCIKEIALHNNVIDIDNREIQNTLKATEQGQFFEKLRVLKGTCCEMSMDSWVQDVASFGCLICAEISAIALHDTMLTQLIQPSTLTGDILGTCLCLGCPTLTAYAAGYYVSCLALYSYEAFLRHEANKINQEEASGAEDNPRLSPRFPPVPDEPPPSYNDVFDSEGNPKPQTNSNNSYLRERNRYSPDNPI